MPRARPFRTFAMSMPREDSLKICVPRCAKEARSEHKEVFLTRLHGAADAAMLRDPPPRIEAGRSELIVRRSTAGPRASTFEDILQRRGDVVQRRIIGFHQDEEQHWVADLECGHTQHVRHDPPWQIRPWVLSEKSRAGFIGVTLNCVKCDALPEGNAR